MQCHMESTKDDLCFSQNIAFVLIKLCLFAFLSLLTSVSNKERLSIYILLSDLLSCEYLLNHILILASFVTLSLVFPGKVSLGGGCPCRQHRSMWIIFSFIKDLQCTRNYDSCWRHKDSNLLLIYHKSDILHEDFLISLIRMWMKTDITQAWFIFA